ncbi:aldo/keto reductase [Actinopolymorpha singaporensis]
MADPIRRTGADRLTALGVHPEDSKVVPKAPAGPGTQAHPARIANHDTQAGRSRMSHVSTPSLGGNDLLARRRLGSTGLEVTPVCLGCGVLGGMPGIFGYDVAAERGVATVRAALASPLNFLDTSAGYSDGESERRVGAAIAEHGGLPPGFVLATKVDPDPRTGDYSGEQVRRSAEQSLERLGLDSFDLLYLHDPEVIGFEAATASGGAVEALVDLAEQGIARHLGVAGGPVDLLGRFVDTGAFEVVLTHNRYTLVDQSARGLLEQAKAAGVAVVNAAPFGGGLLAKGPDALRKYAYREADADLLARVRAMADACAAYDVPLGAAALQYSLRQPLIASTVVGISAPERVDQTLAWATWPIPDELWASLRPLAEAGGPGGPGGPFGPGGPGDKEGG